jgi:EF-P beta-lysylation protein EpmB
MADAISSLDELLTLLGLEPSQVDVSRQVARAFRLRVPRGFVQRMQPGNPLDPLLLQVLPQTAETLVAPDFVVDPVADLENTASPGIIHKYRNRLLLVTTGACAIHCRYCFRRHFPYAEANPRGINNWQNCLDVIRAQPEIEEVILSGGDPLSLSDSNLEPLMVGIAGISHVKTLRLHSRFPVVLPNRIDDDLLSLLTASRKNLVLVIHANHPNELSASTDSACNRLSGAGVTLLNQSVLLRGINDDAGVLAALSQRLFDGGVLPYYLHLLDRVAGAAHFDVDESIARKLVNSMRARLAGYLVPKLVRDGPGLAAKSIIDLGW